MKKQYTEQELKYVKLYLSGVKPYKAMKEAGYKVIDHFRQRELREKVAPLIKNQKKQHHRAFNYGLTIDDFKNLLKKQDYSCAICLIKLEEKKLFIDHDHSCCRGCKKCVRGLLCHKCNNGLGLFDDSTFKFNRAIKYLLGVL